MQVKRIKSSKQNIKNKKRLCYIKYGDVCEELEHSKTSDTITGGHYYYVYATSHILSELADILYLSVNKKKGIVKYYSCVAKNIKPVLTDGIIGKAIGILHCILLILFELFKYQPDHILCVRTYGLLLYYLYARLYRIPFTMSIHTDLKVGKKWRKLIERHILKNADSIICHGPYLSNQARRIIADKEKIIEYNASSSDMIKTKKAKPSNKLNCFAEGSHIISYIGRVESSKGVIDLYKAFKELSKNENSYELCFAGSGAASHLIEKMAVEDKLEKNIHVLGRIDRKVVAELLEKTWVVVTPTRKEFPEGRCMTAMEALSLGVPLIAPEFGPFKYLVKNGVNGFFYKPDSINDLYMKLKLIQQPAIRNKLAKNAAIGSKIFSENLLSYGEAVKISLEIGNG